MKDHYIKEGEILRISIWFDKEEDAKAYALAMTQVKEPILIKDNNRFAIARKITLQDLNNRDFKGYLNNLMTFSGNLK